VRLAGIAAAALLVTLVAGPAASRAPVPAGISPLALLEAMPLARLEPQLREADLVFRRGNGRWSGYFAGASGGEGYFSHVGVLVREADGWHVVHTEADDRTGVGGVRSDRLEDFLTGAHGLAVVRPALSEAQAAAAVQLSAQPQWRSIPFDSSFRLDDEGRAMYCTEWVQALVLAATGEDIARPRSYFGSRAIISVDDLRLSSRVEPVLEHRLAAH